jgi:hypothetical protein
MQLFDIAREITATVERDAQRAVEVTLDEHGIFGRQGDVGPVRQHGRATDLADRIDAGRSARE